MARPIEAVKDINDSKDSWKIVVSCKHLWSLINASTKEQLEMILLDMIQGIVPPFLVQKLKMQLQVGCSYIMQNFKVSNNDFSFRSTKHSFKLVLCGSTSVKKTELVDIPVNYLNIHGLDLITEGRFKYNVLVDIVGGVTEISQSQIIVDNNKSNVVFTMTGMSKEVVQCTMWGKLVVQLYEYYMNHKEDGNIVVLLINARVKKPQGDYPLSISNAWNDTKLVINDVSIEEINKLKESLKNDLPLLSSSSLQVDATQNSQFSEFDKFVWKAEILSLSDIAILQHSDEDDPLEFPYELGAILKKELAIRVFFSIIRPDYLSLATKYTRIPHTSKLKTSDHLEQDQLISVYNFKYNIDCSEKTETKV
ncbi:uncharacterized protein LOC131662273 [Vicia villosa]|uniref:uncharacterized protein LOC131662273 n=1 Tax=Vicia villosa TaxID=3911 RepID=UPI00273CB4ED|nr:uncharacterized protein LOC131662273 [Vicia villosa]